VTIKAIKTISATIQQNTCDYTADTFFSRITLTYRPQALRFRPWPPEPALRFCKLCIFCADP